MEVPIRAEIIPSFTIEKKIRIENEVILKIIDAIAKRVLLIGDRGFGPRASALSGQRANQAVPISYRGKKVVFIDELHDTQTWKK